MSEPSPDAVKPSASVPQLPARLVQEAARQEVPVPEEEEAADDGRLAEAAEEVDPGHGGDVQGGAPVLAPAEPPPGPVSATAGEDDEPPGEDDSASRRHVSGLESKRGEGPRETLNSGKMVDSLEGSVFLQLCLFI